MTSLRRNEEKKLKMNACVLDRKRIACHCIQVWVRSFTIFSARFNRIVCSWIRNEYEFHICILFTIFTDSWNITRELSDFERRAKKGANLQIQYVDLLWRTYLTRCHHMNVHLHIFAVCVRDSRGTDSTSVHIQMHSTFFLASFFTLFVTLFFNKILISFFRRNILSLSLLCK